MLTEVGAVDLADVPQLTPIRRRLLERAQVYYRSFLADHERDPGLVEVTARAQGHLGEVYDLLGNTPAAESAYRQVLVLLREPVKANPGTVALEAEFARAANNLGVVLKKRHHLAEAEAALREAIEHRELLRNLPEDEFRYGRELAESLYQLGTVLARQPARRAEAQDLYKQALTLQGWLEQVVPGWTDVTRDRARTLNNLGNLQRAIAPERVLPSYQQAAALQEQLVKRFPDFPGFRRELGRTYQNIAVARSRDTAAGDEFARRAIDTLHRLVLDFPSVPAYRHEEATAHRTRGQVLAQGNQPAAAEEAYRAAVAIEEKLAQEFADVPEYQQRLADVQGTLAAFLGQGSRKDEADQLFRRALTTREKLLREHPENADYHRDLSWTLNDLGFLQSDRNQLADARATFRRAVAEARRAWDADPKNAEYAGELGRITYNLARTEVDLGQPDTAAATIDELVKLQPDDPENQRRAALIFARCSQRAGADKALPEADRRRRADAYAARAVAALRAAVRQGFTDAGHLQDEEYLPLRQRPDFQELQRELTAKTEKRVT